MINDLLKRIYEQRLIIVAFVIGFAILAFELTAARIVAPYLGNTIYVWTSIIGTILAALAIGYAFGGRWADRRGQSVDVVLLLLIAAVLMALVSFTKDSTLGIITGLGGNLQFQAFISSVWLFAPPASALGAASPYLARLNITDVKTSGQKLSNINAAETIGSLAGTFFTGYYLFGILGTRYLILLIACLLVAVSFLLQARKLIALRLIFLAMVLIFGLSPARISAAGVVAEIDTAYSKYLVRDVFLGYTHTRVLQTDNQSLQSGVARSGSDELVFGYTRAFAYSAELKPSARNILIIGGGAYTFPEYMGKKYPDARIDVVEIDEKLPQISEDYFYYDPPKNVRNIAADGRQFLNDSTRKYDLLYVDAFTSLVPPFQLTTQEASERMSKAISSDGLVVINLISAVKGPDAKLFDHVYATLESKFRYVSAYAVYPGTPTAQSQNLLLYASQQPLNADNIAAIRAQEPEFNQIIAGKVTPSAGNKILTDDFAPVEQLIGP